MSSAAAAPRPPRRPRTLVQKLAPIVLGFEALVVFLVGLTMFGLKALPAGIEPWWAIVGGAVLAVACIVIAGMITRPWRSQPGGSCRSSWRWRRSPFRPCCWSC